MPVAVVYARYSSDLQREASIEDQLRLCRRLIEQQGWQYRHAYTDRAVSGATALRPGYQLLLEDARRGGFDVVVAEALDRLSRDQEDIAGLLKRLRFAGVRLFTVAEGEIGELHVGLKGTMNALFLKDLAQKVRRGLEGRVREGRSGGGLCFGYDLVREYDARGEPIRGARKINGEVNRRRHGTELQRASVQSELAAVSRRLDGLVDAISEGLRGAGLQQRLDELEARKAELEAKLVAPAPTPVRLHPNLAQLYREKLAELHTALADPGLHTEALGLIRGLIERVEVRSAEGGFHIELTGEIASMMTLSAGAESVGSDLARASVKVVAGARNHRRFEVSISI
jgi:DNA invertase Pin-like site-specific DNA recombinase